MRLTNVYLQEAMEKQVITPAQISKDIKQMLQTCRLTKFKSNDACSRFYSAFFLSTLETELDPAPSTQDWQTIYNTLLNDPSFLENLRMFVVMYQPETYDSIFHPFFLQLITDVEYAGKRKTAFLANGKATLNMIQMKFNEIKYSTTDIISDGKVKFLTVTDQTLTSMIVSLNKRIESYIAQDADPNDIAPIIGNDDIETYPLPESAWEVIHLLENADTWINQHLQEALNEGIINNAKEKAKEAIVKSRKIEKAFDELVMKKFNDYRLKRRNMKHSEMVGESLRISREIKRLLKSGVIGIFSPAAGVLHWLVTYALDRSFDNDDRKILVADIKDEIEIIDEKIAMAERNGDDKAKIELMRIRQKYYREYERINKVRFDRSRLQKDITSN